MSRELHELSRDNPNAFPSHLQFVIVRLQIALDRAIAERNEARAALRDEREDRTREAARPVVPAGIDDETERALQRAQLEHERRVADHDRTCNRSSHAKCPKAIVSLPGFRKQRMSDWLNGHGSEKVRLLKNADAEEQKALAPRSAPAAHRLEERPLERSRAEKLRGFYDSLAPDERQDVDTQATERARAYVAKSGAVNLDDVVLRLRVSRERDAILEAILALRSS